MMPTAEGFCEGCGRVFAGARGLRAHQASRFAPGACRPDIKDSDLARLIWLHKYFTRTAEKARQLEEEAVGSRFAFSRSMERRGWDKAARVAGWILVKGIPEKPAKGPDKTFGSIMYKWK